MEEEKEIMVDCPKEGKKVPFWHCAGSGFKGKLPCPHVEEALINHREKYARVKCDPNDKM